MPPNIPKFRISAFVNGLQPAIDPDKINQSLDQLEVEDGVRKYWESLTSSQTAVPLPDAHCVVIDERLAEHESNPDDVVTRNEVLAEGRRG